MGSEVGVRGHIVMTWPLDIKVRTGHAKRHVDFITPKSILKIFLLWDIIMFLWIVKHICVTSVTFALVFMFYMAFQK